MALKSRIHGWRVWAALIPGVITGATILIACTTVEAPPIKPPPETADDGNPPPVLEPPPPDVAIEPDETNVSSGAFGAGERPTGVLVGANRDAGANDAGTKVLCGPSAAAGDLAVVEIMIASKSGAGDPGEWIEVQNTRDCWVKLKGVHVESPRGASTNGVTITDDIDLAPRASFLVADTLVASHNNALPGLVFAWDATDVLKNAGDTISIKLGTVAIDTLTYPWFSNVTAGRALAFPSDCAWTDRSDWTRWSVSYAEFAPGCTGTPNGENTDVKCF